ncbi:MAG TPA: GGDEF domain-containing protein, partial [Xanthobacteraceae bacterium]|nr:GGDEF domain-containing protein [Xanthobacteraceae bacterium]
ALRTAGAYPILEARWADAPAALQARPPQAVVLAEPCPDRARASALAKALSTSAEQDTDLFVPVIARTRDDAASGLPPSLADALTIAAKAPAERLVRRLTAALRVRTLHGTVLRRMRTLATRGQKLPELPDADPLDEARVLVAGRGRSYPGLCTATGERVGVIGALTVEGAASALKARDVDAMIIGEGFGTRVIEALLTVLAEDARFRDLPVAVVGKHSAVGEHFAAALPNLERIADGPTRVIEHLLPYIRVHAFARRLKRMLTSLDAKGAIDPDTGLLANTIFWRDLNRAVDDADKRGAALSIARFSLPAADRRTSLEAARLVGKLMRQVDFACQEADKSIFTVFTETDLRAAHVVARRIASVLKNVMLTTDGKRAGSEPAVTLATLKPSDNTDSLIARVVEEPPQSA